MSQTTAIIDELVKATANTHPLISNHPDYLAGFKEAFANVYSKLDEKTIRDKLTDGFRLGSVSYDERKFLESAVELSVQNHLYCNSGFQAEKKVNPNNDKDVDAYFIKSGIEVAVEVKCVHKEKENPGSFQVKTAGRLPDRSQVTKLQDTLQQHGGKSAEIIKNRDQRIKDYLCSAHNKFSPDAGVAHANILFLACGTDHDMREVWDTLYSNEGLFTLNPFHSPADYALVDIVVVSSIRYRHECVRRRSDWTLDDALLLPFFNRHSRKNSVASNLMAALDAFPHKGREYREYTPADKDAQGDDELGKWIVGDLLKLTYFTREHLDAEHWKRFFPTLGPRDADNPSA